MWLSRTADCAANPPPLCVCACVFVSSCGELLPLCFIVLTLFKMFALLLNAGLSSALFSLSPSLRKQNIKLFNLQKHFIMVQLIKFMNSSAFPFTLLSGHTCINFLCLFGQGLHQIVILRAARTLTRLARYKLETKSQTRFCVFNFFFFCFA